MTAALHGDEINGTGAVRQLIQDPDFQLLRGSLILVPVLNILAFDRHSRYLPDRRDLNRSFPGSASGSLAGRMARIIFEEIVSRCDFGIDLHTAAVRRTNYPNVRADLADPDGAPLAEAFGAEIIIDGKGPEGRVPARGLPGGLPDDHHGGRRGLEGGAGHRRVGDPRRQERAAQPGHARRCRPSARPSSSSSRRPKWIRAERGGFLQFHIKPGDIVEKDQPLATNTTLLGHERSTLHAPFDAVVIGMTSLPAVSPGEPVCNLGKLPEGSDPGGAAAPARRRGRPRPAGRRRVGIERHGLRTGRGAGTLLG